MPLPLAPPQYDQAIFQQILRRIEQVLPHQVGIRSKASNPGITPVTYVVKGYTVTRTLDLSTNPTQAQINNFVLTVIGDLIQRSALS